jgi:sRNA-binding protein
MKGHGRSGRVTWNGCSKFGGRKVYNQDHNEVIAILARLFPKAFFVNPRMRVPLKFNIVADIEKQGCNDLLPYDVGPAVDWYMGHYGYEVMLGRSAGEWRVDLDGNQVVRVTEQEAQPLRKEPSKLNKKEKKGINRP